MIASNVERLRGGGRPCFRGMAARWVLGSAAAVLLLLPSSGSALGVKKITRMVPMRDGTRLATDVYLPQVTLKAYPAVLIRTPYGKNRITIRHARYALHNHCILVVQDLRGRFQSQGDGALVFHDDGWENNRDGHETIRWISRQPWCNGKVGTWGPSAMGIVQNLMAPDAPPSLQAQFVMMAFSNMYTQAVYQGGAFRKELVEGWIAKNGFQEQNLQELRSRPKYDPFWDDVNPEAQAHRVNVPAIFEGGWHDAFLQGTINSFVTVNTQGGAAARGNCRLIIGPWAHTDIRRLVDPTIRSNQPLAADPFRFFGHWLSGDANGVRCDRPVHYYVMGDRTDRRAPGNFWRSADTWPPPARLVPFHFHADGTLRPETVPTAEDRLSYRYDPKNPVPTLGGQNLNLPSGPKDQRPVESRPDVLLFTTERLTEPLEITGRIKARLYVSSDCPDTDFTVKLTDVYPDGRSLLVADGILRGRYHRSFTEEELLEPGKVYVMTVDLWSTSIVVNRGHKIRVAVSSSNAPRFEPNANTGRPAGETTETRVATNTLHLSPEHPSRILLPIYDAPAGRVTPSRILVRKEPWRIDVAEVVRLRGHAGSPKFSRIRLPEYLTALPNFHAVR